MPKLVVCNFEGTIGDVRKDTGKLELYNIVDFERLVLSVVKAGKEFTIMSENQFAIVSDKIKSIDLYSVLPQSIRDRVIILGADETECVLNSVIFPSGDAPGQVLKEIEEKKIHGDNIRELSQLMVDFYVNTIRNDKYNRMVVTKMGLDPDKHRYYETLQRYHWCVMIRENDHIWPIIRYYNLNERDNDRLFHLRFLHVYVKFVNDKEYNTTDVILMDTSEHNCKSAASGTLRGNFDAVHVKSITDATGKYSSLPVNLSHFESVAKKVGLFSYKVEGGITSLQAPTLPAAISSPQHKVVQQEQGDVLAAVDPQVYEEFRNKMRAKYCSSLK